MKSSILHEKFERICRKSCSLGAPTAEDDGRKSAIDNKHHLIGQQKFSSSDYFSSTRFLWLAIFCCFFLCKIPSRTIYYVFCSTNVRLVITNFVWLSRVCG